MTDLSANALRVLEARYLLRDRERRLIETPGEMFERVARAVAQAEGDAASHWAERFHALLAKGDFLPNSPTLMNAGTPFVASVIAVTTNKYDRQGGRFFDLAQGR